MSQEFNQITVQDTEEEEVPLIQRLLEGLKKLKDKDVTKEHKEIIEFINLMSSANYSVFYDDEKHNKWQEVMSSIDQLINSLKDLKTNSAKIVGVNLAFSSIKGKPSSGGYF